MRPVFCCSIALASHPAQRATAKTCVKGIARHAERIEQQRRVHLDVGLERAARLVGGERRQCLCLDLAGEGEPADIGLEQGHCGAQHLGARIADTEHAVAETHQACAGGELRREPTLDIARGLDGVEQSSTGPGAPPCRGPVKAQ
jgi:hypothetical protein